MRKPKVMFFYFQFSRFCDFLFREMLSPAKSKFSLRRATASDERKKAVSHRKDIHMKNLLRRGLSSPKVVDHREVGHFRRTKVYSWARGRTSGGRRRYNPDVNRTRMRNCLGLNSTLEVKKWHHPLSHFLSHSWLGSNKIMSLLRNLL